MLAASAKAVLPSSQLAAGDGRLEEWSAAFTVAGLARRQE
jgi:hypothetical protein